MPLYLFFFQKIELKKKPNKNSKLWTKQQYTHEFSSAFSSCTIYDAACRGTSAGSPSTWRTRSSRSLSYFRARSCRWLSYGARPPGYEPSAVPRNLADRIAKILTAAAAAVASKLLARKSMLIGFSRTKSLCCSIWRPCYCPGPALSTFGEKFIFLRSTGYQKSAKYMSNVGSFWRANFFFTRIFVFPKKIIYVRKWVLINAIRSHSILSLNASIDRNN